MMIHDISLTEHDAGAGPDVLRLADALTGGSLRSWEPDSGTRIALVPRDGGPVRWCDDDAFWVWHLGGAYELDDPVAGNPIVVDYVQWQRPGGLVAGLPRDHGRLARAIIDPAAGTLRCSVLADERVEFPRIDDRQLTAHHRIIATAGVGGWPRRGTGPAGPDTPSWFEPDTGTCAHWHAGDLASAKPPTHAIPKAAPLTTAGG